MYSKLPFSMENIPRQRSMGCLSLKFGSIMTALVVILYSLLSLNHCFMELSRRAPSLEFHKTETMITFGVLIVVTIVHSMSFMLSCMMMLGALKEQATMIKPWVVFKSIQIIVQVLLVLWVTVTAFNQMYDNALQIYILQFLSILIEFYMLVIVASYYKELTENNYETERLRNVENAWYTEV